MNKTSNLRRHGFLLFMMAVAVFFTSCTSPVTTSVETKKSISFLHYFSDSLRGGIDSLVSGFNQEQSQFVLNAVPIDHEAYKTSIVKALAEGNPPDLYSYWAGARTAAVADKLMPIDAIWTSENLDQKFSSPLIKTACEVKGQKYLLPITQHYITFFYNIELFQKYNLSPPRTWDEFLTVCQVLKDNGITPLGLGSKTEWPAQFWFDYLMLRTAGPEAREQLMRGQIPYDDDRVKRAFSLWQDLINKGYFNADPNLYLWSAEPLQGLSDESIGMTLMGTWAISILESDFKMVAGKDLGTFSFPIIDDVPYAALGAIDGIVVPKDSVNSEGALKAIAFFARSESQRAMAMGSGALSPSKEVALDSYGILQQEIIKDIDQSKVWAFNFDLATPPEIAELGLALFSEFLYFPAEYEKLLMEVEKKTSVIFNKD